MFERKWIKWLLLLALIVPLLVACGGETEEPTSPPESETEVEEPAEEATEAPAEEPAEEATDAPAEEPTEEPMGEPTEEAAGETDGEIMAEETMPTMMGIEACEVAEEGAFAGVDPNGTSIIWWHQHSGLREEQLIPLVEKFNQGNACGITVEPQLQGGYDEIRDKVNASISAGELPAALIVGYQNDQAFYELNDALVDHNEYVNDPHWGLREQDVNDFYETFWEQSVHPSFDNQRLGVPPNRSMEVIYYNQTVLEELGFDGPPETPEEFSEMACAHAEQMGNGTGGYILRDDASAVASWTYAFGGDILTDDGTQYNYATDATVQAMAFLKRLYHEGCAYFFTEGFPNPELAARRAVFTQGSSSGLPFYISDFNTIAEEEGREPDAFGVAAIPHTTENPVQNIYGADIMITNTTPEQQLAAWIFAKWFMLPEIQAEWVQISNYFPTRKSASEHLTGYVEANPQWGQALEMLDFSAYEPQLISYQAVRDRTSESFNIIMNELPEDATEDDIRAVLEELTTFANEHQDELMEDLE